MYDEAIQRFARRIKVQPITFAHPQEDAVLDCFSPGRPQRSVILTGTPGDGKTFLCRKVWEQLGGQPADWSSEDDYHRIDVPSIHGPIPLHIIPDLTAMPMAKATWPFTKSELLGRACRAILSGSEDERFLIAANDGQLLDSLRAVGDTPELGALREALEVLLVEEAGTLPTLNLDFFNLSRGSSAALLDRALAAFLDHPGWQHCWVADAPEGEAFGSNCPIRRNYELLRDGLVQQRLRSLLELCDYNRLHIPIRQVLLLLTNSVLGHPGVKDYLMTAVDVPNLIRDGDVGRASLFANIFGANLPEARREALPVFDYLSRYRIGYETTNRIDNLLIFGDLDSGLRAYFESLVASDRFYGATPQYKAAQQIYIESGDEVDSNNLRFLDHLVAQRQGLFFKIPESQARELRLWDLTVFRFAGEYLDQVVRVLANNARIDRTIHGRLVRGLNRVFMGMLASSERELLLTTSVAFSHERVSRVLEDTVSVAPRLGERVEIALRNGFPTLNVILAPQVQVPLELHLVRYEFLSRVAEGALPASFSKECYEDILAFKTRLISGVLERRRLLGDEQSPSLTFRLVDLNSSGVPIEDPIEVADE